MQTLCERLHTAEAMLAQTMKVSANGPHQQKFVNLIIATEALRTDMEGPSLEMASCIEVEAFVEMLKKKIDVADDVISNLRTQAFDEATSNIEELLLDLGHKCHGSKDEKCIFDDVDEKKLGSWKTWSTYAHKRLGRGQECSHFEDGGAED